MEQISRLAPFIVYVGGVFLVTLLLAYPIWLLIQAAGFHSVPFNKMCFRLLESCALVGLWPLMRFLKLGTANDWGLGAGATRRARLGGVVWGYLAGIVLLLVVVALIMAAEVRTPRADAAWEPAALIRMALKATIAAAVIALVEELWFRGALQRALASRFSLVTVVAATSTLYALVHFIRPDVEVPASQVDWSSGWAVLSGSVSRFSDPGILDSLAALISVGVLLSLVRHGSGRIWECVGLHAGFIVVIRMTRKLTTIDPEAANKHLVGDFDGVIGLLACVIISLAAIGYWRLCMQRTVTEK